MATIVVGDIHANLGPLNDLLGQLRSVVDEKDVVVFLGDYIDRGSDAKGCIDALLQFQEEVPARVRYLCGNHEAWLLRTLGDFRKHSWLLGMEAFETIRSYSPHGADTLRAAAAAEGPRLVLDDCALPYEEFLTHVPESHIRFLQGLLPSWRTEYGLCVHGGLDPDGSRLEDQPREALLWGAEGFPERYRGSEIVVYGHRNNAEIDSTGTVYRS